MACPECVKGRHDTALSVLVRDDGSAVWKCFRCHAHGGIRGERALNVVRAKPGPQAGDKQPSKLAACRAIWKQTQPLADTPGEKYLRLRQCALPPSDTDLRFHAALFCPEVGRELPALVARVTTVIGDKAIGIHRIWFRAGEARAVTKMRLGGCDEPVCIRLWRNVGATLGIAEGIETALAAAQVFTPMWSTLDVGQMTKFPLVPGLESLTVFSDYDTAGIAAANAVGARYLRAGRNANLLRPKNVGQDFNDVMMQKAQA